MELFHLLIAECFVENLSQRLAESSWWGERPREPLLKKSGSRPKRLARTLAPPLTMPVLAMISTGQLRNNKNY